MSSTDLMEPVWRKLAELEEYFTEEHKKEKGEEGGQSGGRERASAPKHDLLAHLSHEHLLRFTQQLVSALEAAHTAGVGVVSQSSNSTRQQHDATAGLPPRSVYANSSRSSLTHNLYFIEDGAAGGENPLAHSPPSFFPPAPPSQQLVIGAEKQQLLSRITSSNNSSAWGSPLLSRCGSEITGRGLKSGTSVHKTTTNSSGSQNSSLTAAPHNLPSFTRHSSVNSNSSNRDLCMSTQLFKDNDDLGFETFNGFTILQEIGAGASGRVMLAVDGDSGERRAIKMIPRRHAISENRDSDEVLREVAIMKKLHHSNMVRLYEVIDDPEEDTIYLVMQYIDEGPILRLNPTDCTCPPLSLSVVSKYVSQMILALRYMHSRKVVHRDIKPDNILVDSKGDLYLADFGISSALEAGTSEKIEQQNGTPYFMAPELIEGKAVTTASDMWSVGVTIYCMIFGCLPFLGRTYSETLSLVCHGQLVFPPATADKAKWKNLLKLLLEREPAKRLTASGMSRMPMFNNSSSIPPSPSPPKRPSGEAWPVSPSSGEASTNTISSFGASGSGNSDLASSNFEVTPEEQYAAITMRRSFIQTRQASSKKLSRNNTMRQIRFGGTSEGVGFGGGDSQTNLFPPTKRKETRAESSITFARAE